MMEMELRITSNKVNFLKVAIIQLGNLERLKKARIMTKSILVSIIL